VASHVMGGSAGLASGAAARMALCAATMPHIAETLSGQSLLAPPPDIEPPAGTPPLAPAPPPLLVSEADVPPAPPFDARAPPDPTSVPSFAPQPNAVARVVATKVPRVFVKVTLVFPTRQSSGRQYRAPVYPGRVSRAILIVLRRIPGIRAVGNRWNLPMLAR
jgi:hypothetical protein